MKIYLASYTQPDNHGPGRKIAISSTKPDELTVDGVFDHVMPSNETLQSYKDKQLVDQKQASDFFVETYEGQLKKFFKEVEKSAQTEGTSVVEQLPLRSGDTLLSWEREGYTSYRPILARFLEEVGYDVVLK